MGLSDSLTRMVKRIRHRVDILVVSMSIGDRRRVNS